MWWHSSHTPKRQLCHAFVMLFCCYATTKANFTSSDLTAKIDNEKKPHLSQKKYNDRTLITMMMTSISFRNATQLRNKAFNFKVIAPFQHHAISCVEKGYFSRWCNLDQLCTCHCCPANQL